MTDVHILSPGFATSNSGAFLFPIIRYRTSLESIGVRCRVFESITPNLTECDVLIIDSKHYRNAWSDGEDVVLDELSDLHDKANRLFWFDTTDGTGTLQTAVLPIVDRYYKGQLVKDRSTYLRALYGMRIYTDYYHRKYGVEDDPPANSNPVQSNEELKKLALSWNFGLANWEVRGPLRARLYRHIGWRKILQPPRRWIRPSADRGLKMSSRFSANYYRATVRFQRQKIREILSDYVSTQRIPRREYFSEMEQSIVTVSPFGWGEMCYRDFEAFLSGCALVKPSMSHLETWPNFYQDGVTYLSHNWDLEDLSNLVERIYEDPGEYLAIAKQGQNVYKTFMLGEQARDAFVSRFTTILNG